MELSNDKRHATLSIAGTYTADELQDLVVSLATLRSRMEPQVRQNPISDGGEALEAIPHEDPLFSIARHRNGDFWLCVRSTGFGWNAFVFPTGKAKIIGAYIASRVDISVDLISEELGNLGTPQ